MTYDDVIYASKLSGGSGGGGGSSSDYVQHGLIVLSSNIGTGELKPQVTAAASYKTIECCFSWSVVSSSSKQGRVFSLIRSSTNGGLVLNINADYPQSNLEWKIGGTWTDDGESGLSIPAGELHTVSIVTDSVDNAQGTKIYIDGQLRKTLETAISEAQSFDKLGLLMSPSFSERELTAALKSFRVYSRLLTDAEIARNYAVDCIKYG